MGNDEMFENIMQKSAREMPFPNLEEEVMHQIREKERRAAITKNLTYSWAFLIVGTILGVIISMMLPSLKVSVLGVSPQYMTIVFQIVFAIVILLQLDSLISFMKRHKTFFWQKNTNT